MRILLLAICLLLFLPGLALGNSATSVMIAEMHHLLFGNALLGCIEGLIIAYVFKWSMEKGFFFGRAPRTVVYMVAANYFSAFAGMFLLTHIAGFAPTATYGNALWILSALILAAFLLTLILEYPFVYALLNRTRNRLKKALVANLLVQALTTLLLFAYYANASSLSLYTETNYVCPEALTLPNTISLYYISTEGDVRVISAERTKSRLVKDMDLQQGNARFVFRYPDRWQAPWGLALYLDKEDIYVDLDVEFNTPPWFYYLQISLDDYLHNHSPDKDHYIDPHAYNIITQNGMTFEETPEVYTPRTISPVYIDGPQGFYSLYFSTPLMADTGSRWVNQLPDNKAVFQFGHKQILLFNYLTRDITVLAEGHTPMAVMN